MTEQSVAVPYRLRPRPNPFRSPRPAVRHQPRAWAGDYTEETRTPAEVREVMQRRVHGWFKAQHDLLPRDLSREELVRQGFTVHGWQTVATISDDTGSRPLHAWALTHLTDGIVLYSDRARDGDLGPDYQAPTGGAWGGSPHLMWAEDLGHLMGIVVTDPVHQSPYPHVRTTRVLAAHLYLTADPTEQETVAFLLTLTGRDVGRYLQHWAHDLSVHTC